MKEKSRLKSILMSISCCAIFQLLPAQAHESPLASMQGDGEKITALLEIAETSGWSDGKSDLDNLSRKTSQLKDYYFDTSMKGLEGSKLKTGGGRYYFKAPKNVRLEVKSTGVNNGAVVVKGENERIIGIGGGMLKFVKMNLEPDSRILRLPNGYNAISSDLFTMFSALQKRAAAGAKIRISKKTLSDKRWTEPVLLLDIVHENKSKRELIFIGSETRLPLEWDVYLDNRLISITSFKNYRLNTGLKNNLFTI